MRRVRYRVAASLDGFIAGPGGEADWIPSDPEVDFRALFAQFDTFLVGRRTYEAMAAHGRGSTPGVKTYVFSRTLRPEDHPAVTIVSEDVKATVASLRAESGKDIWLFGGGSLFRSLLDLGLVDTIEIAVVPILLGGGIPMLPPGGRTALDLTGHRVYGTTGIVSLEYAVKASSAEPAAFAPK